MSAVLHTGAFRLAPEDRPRLAAELATRGFVAFGPSALGQEIFAALVAEAATQRAGAWEYTSDDPHAAQHVWRAHPGALAAALLTADETLDLVRDLTGLPVRPSLEASCFTYYEAPQHFLGVHVDRLDACLATLIVYLDVLAPEGTDPSAGLGLFVFAPGAGAGTEPLLRVTARANRAVVGLGSRFPHCRPNLRPGERVIALTACFRAADETGAPQSGPEARAVAEARTAQGMGAWRRGDLVAARRLFDEAIAHDPAAAQAWSGRGSVRWSEADFEGALEAFNEAARRDCADPSHWSNVGLCLRELGRGERAIGVFSVALRLDPEYAPAWNEWGNVLQDQGHIADALPCYFRALALDPSRAVVHHNLGVAYVRLGQRDQAYDAFRAALRRDPAYAPSLEEIGVLLAGAGHTDVARDMLARAGTHRASSLRAELGLEDPAGAPSA